MSPLAPDYWDALSREMNEPQFQEQIARYKRDEHLKLLSSWAPARVARLFKTDLFEEAQGEDLLLDSLVPMSGAAIGMDISLVTTSAARKRVPTASYFVGDASALPLRAGCLDLIVSISTLDHLPPALFPHAIDEFARVLRPGGCLILTLDSAHNPLHVLSNVIRRRLRMIYAEHCYRIGEVAALLAHRPLKITDATATYHIPFPLNFLAKRLQKVLGARSHGLIRWMIAVFKRLDAFPTRIFTGRYIALRIVRS
jgi:SAM-dependent methyltransferase